MRTGALVAGGVLAGLLIGASVGAALAWGRPAEPAALLRNGLLEGWVVTRDDEALLCTDPVVFVHARQIECP
jgi:hypothetical protein